MGPAIEMLGRLGGEHHGRHRLARRPRRLYRQGADDQLGASSRHDIRAAGVTFANAAGQSGPPTARCLIFVTPDAQRTMNTYLGACVELGPEDVDEALIAAAKVTYLEGYLWDRPRAKDAFRKAAAVAHEAERKVALTLSDPFCVERHRAEFLELVEGPGRHPVRQRGGDHARSSSSAISTRRWRRRAARSRWRPSRAARRARSCCRQRRIAARCRPSRSSAWSTPPAPATSTPPASSTGSPAAGRRADCARIGAIAAAEVISHVGARPERPLKALVAERLG